ncbi:MAG: hypothetical protein CM1200mP14_26050 [Gammaproteobacteria bacterium]|nr:MAG: hypothetical protein CM1200mP14_26050 [Gammaproteobacteria bacterium]
MVSGYDQFTAIYLKLAINKIHVQDGRYCHRTSSQLWCALSVAACDVEQVTAPTTPTSITIDPPSLT